MKHTTKQMKKVVIDVFVLVSLGFLFTLPFLSTSPAQAADPEKLLNKAQKAKGKNDIAGAIEILTDLLQNAPDHVEGNLFMAQIQRSEGNFDAALANIDRALKVNSSKQELFEERCRIIIAMQDWEQAETAIATLKEKFPQDPMIYFFQAAVFRGSENTEKALELMQAYIQQAPTDYEAIEIAAKDALDAKHYDVAKTYYSTLKNAFPNEFKYAIKLSEAELYLDNLAGSRQLVNSALDIAKKSGRESSADIPILAYGHYILALAFQKENNKDEAIGEYSVAIELYPVFFKAYIDYARYMMQLNDDARALEVLEKANQLFPRNGQVLFSMGELNLKQGKLQQAYTYLKDSHTRLGRFKETEQYEKYVQLLVQFKDTDEAVNVLTTAIEAFPQTLGFHRTRGMIYQQKGMSDKALEDYTTALGIDPKDTDTYNLLGKLYEEKKNFEQAALYYEQAYALNPTLPGILERLANMYYQMKKYPKANELFQKLMTTKGTDPEFLYKYAFMMDEMNDLAKAKELYQQLLGIVSDFLPAINNLGIIYVKQNNLTEAEKQFKRAIEINPTFKDAHRNLAYIYQQQGKPEEAQQELQKAQ